MTATHEIERKESVPESTPEEVPQRHGRTYQILAVAIAALVGFGVGWLVFRDTGSDTAAEVTEIADDGDESAVTGDLTERQQEVADIARGYAEAKIAGDGDMAASYMTDDATSNETSKGPDLSYSVADRSLQQNISNRVPLQRYKTFELVLVEDTLVVMKGDVDLPHDVIEVIEFTGLGDVKINKTTLFLY